MAHAIDRKAGFAKPWRLAGWGGAAALLLLPAVAMQFTDEVVWNAADFGVIGAMLLAAGGAFELAVRTSGSRAYRAGAALAIVGAFLLIWVNLAVGIIGSENNPANLVFAGVLAVGLGLAVAGRFRPQGMARALGAMALVHAAVPLVVIIAGLGSVLEATGLTVFFVALWLTSAGLFRIAAAGR